MADPEARVVVTARDATGAAFASAEKQLSRFARSAYQLRSIFAGFGVVVSGRMFANWIKDAIEVEKLTTDQAKAIGNASKAVGALNSAFQDVARTAATQLAPALEHAAKFWKEFFFPSGSQFGQGADQIREQVDAQIEQVERLQRLLANQVSYDANANWFDRFVFGEHSENITDTTAKLAAARVELERLRAALLAAQGAGSSEPSFEQFLGQIQYDEEMRRLAAIAKGQDLSPEIEAFVGNLQRAEAIEKSMATEVERQVEAWNEAAALFDMGFLSPETMRRLDEEQLKMFDLNAIRSKYKAPLKQLETEAEKTAKMIGASFQDAFTGWILGTERSFKDLLQRLAVEMATSALFKGLASVFPGGSFFSNFFGGARAEGGPVSSGKGYLVGERGPEMFFPGQSGMIAANAGGPSFSIVNNIDARGADPSVAARLPMILAENNRRLMGEIKDKQRRGRF